MVGRAASGARILGDDVQHLIVWYHVLRSQRPDETIETLEVEARGAGNVDDLVVRRADGHTEYWQVKASVDDQTPLSSDWLMARAPGKRSLLQRLHASWISLRVDGRPTPTVTLATTKAAADADSVLVLADRNNQIADAMAIPGFAAARAEWAGHVDVTEHELLEFLQHLIFDRGTTEAGWLRLVDNAAAASGCRSDEDATARGVAEVRGWVKDPRRTFTRDDLRAVLTDLGTFLPSPQGTLVVAQLDHVAAPAGAVVLDWVDKFDGHDPGTRRQFRDPATADDCLAQLARARATFLADGRRHVEVRGPMRLPAWFACGFELGSTRGFGLSVDSFGERWTTTAPAAKGRRLLEPADLPAGTPAGTPWVVSVNVAADIAPDVDAYAAARFGPAARLNLQVAGGAGNQSVPDDASARRLALDVRDLVRRLRRDNDPSRVHLFLGAPAVLALFLGHAWDRMPPTTTYWDLGRPGSYAPAFSHG